MGIQIGMGTNQGWECPRCHAINAPTTPSCWCLPRDRTFSDFCDCPRFTGPHAPHYDSITICGPGPPPKPTGPPAQEIRKGGGRR